MESSLKPGSSSWKVASNLGGQDRVAVKASASQ